MRRKLLSVLLAAPILLTAVTAVGPEDSAKADSSVVIAYQSSGWRYEQVAHGDNDGFQAASYDDSAWPTGTAAFGSIDPPTCSWNDPSQVHTNWDLNTDMLVRRHFSAPAGMTSMHLDGTIDNSADIYLNGVLLQHVDSGNCQAGAIDIDIPASRLAADNILAVRGIDTGVADYLDMQLTATTAPAPTLAVTPVTGSPMTRFTAKVQGNCPDTQQILVYNPATNSYLTDGSFADLSDYYTDSADPSLSDLDFKVGELGNLRVDLLCDLNVVASVPISVSGTSYVAMGDSYSSGEGAAESTFQPDTVGPDRVSVLNRGAAGPAPAPGPS